MLDRAIAFALDRLDQLASRRSSVAPLCKSPLGSEADYLRLWDHARTELHPAADAYERASGAAIDPEWFHALGLLTQVVIKRSPICYQHGRLLYSTLARYIRERGGRDLNIVETGTARGFSSLCLAKALADAGATGKIVTFDVLPHDARMFWNCVSDIHGPRSRAELLRDYSELSERYILFHRGDTRTELRKMSFPRIHFAFLDSTHTHDHVMAEFASIRGRQRPGDVLFFDDYGLNAYPGVTEAADEICRGDGYSPTVVTVSAQRTYLIAEKQ